MFCPFDISWRASLRTICRIPLFSVDFWLWATYPSNYDFFMWLLYIISPCFKMFLRFCGPWQTGKQRTEVESTRINGPRNIKRTWWILISSPRSEKPFSAEDRIWPEILCPSAEAIFVFPRGGRVEGEATEIWILRGRWVLSLFLLRIFFL